MSKMTQFEQSVELIKPLVYRIVWPNGEELLVTGTHMLERGIEYLNAECEIHEYEVVTMQERRIREQVEIIRAAATEFVAGEDFYNSSPERSPSGRRLKHELTNYDRILSGKTPFAFDE